MKIAGICIKNFPVNNNNCKSFNVLSEQDSVSFSGKVKAKKKSTKFPFRLTSKYQDVFHTTMTQVNIRKYMELKNKGLSPDEIVQVWAGENCSEAEIQEFSSFVKRLQEKIDMLDSSFEEVIPSVKDTIYYRGIFDTKGNKAIDVIRNAKVGDIIQPDNGYPFLSTDYLEAQTFAQSIEGKKTPESSVLMKVKVPKGVKVSRDLNPKLSLFETNVVLPRGIRYKVLENKVQNNQNYIVLEYLDCATDRNE